MTLEMTKPQGQTPAPSFMCSLRHILHPRARRHTLRALSFPNAADGCISLQQKVDLQGTQWAPNVQVLLEEMRFADIVEVVGGLVEIVLVNCKSS